MKQDILDMARVGFAVSSMLHTSRASEDTVREAAMYLWHELSESIPLSQLNVFLSADDDLFQEIANIQNGHFFLDTHVLSLHQVPSAIVHEDAPWYVRQGHAHELWVPFRGETLLGFLIMVTDTPMDAATLPAITVFQHAVSLGVRHLVAMRHAQSTLRLLEAVTNAARRITQSEDAEQVLATLVESGVDCLGFDRATVFLYDESGQIVRTLLARVGHHTVVLPGVSVAPTLGPEARVIASLRAVWVPLRRNSILFAEVLYDNLYSHEPVVEGALQAAKDLGAQAVLALQTVDLLQLLSKKATRDDLTGLYRVDSFYDRAEQELCSAAVEGTECGFLIVDLDHFKQVNDSFGHPAGDAVLVQTTSVILQTVPATAAVGRIGGDEFVILLPRTSRAESADVGRRLVRAFAETHFRFLPEANQHLTISVGIASYPYSGATVNQLMHIADQALYQAKRTGRAQASVSPGEG